MRHSTRSHRSRILVPATLGIQLLAAGCAPRTLVLPAGPGEPYPAFADTFAVATRRCQGVGSLTAELALSGRVGHTRLRARVLAGISTPDSVRLEGVAPFGAPGFILAAHREDAVLLLPRDGRVLLGASVTEILDALVGLPMTPHELLAVATGCVSPSATPIGGRAYPDGWVAIDLQDGGIAYLRQGDDAPTVVAGRVSGFVVEYRTFAYGFPAEIRLRTPEPPPAGRPATDLVVLMSQIETNRRLGDEVFRVVVPETALPIGLEELRASGPLADEMSSPDD